MKLSDTAKRGRSLVLTGTRKYLLSDIGARAFGIILGFVSWTALARAFPNELMPYPAETFGIAWNLVAEGSALFHLQATLVVTFWGFVGSLLLGTLVGAVMGLNKYGKHFFTLYIILGLSIPALVWAVASTLIFGFNILAPIVATVLTTFPFVAVNVWKGVENIDNNLVEMSLAYNVSYPQLMRRMILPNIASELFTAVRFGLAISWKVVTVAEIFAASKGIGYRLIQAYDTYRFEEA